MFQIQERISNFNRVFKHNILSEPVCEKPTVLVPTRSDTNRAVQSQKIDPGCKL